MWRGRASAVAEAAGRWEGWEASSAQALGVPGPAWARWALMLLLPCNKGLFHAQTWNGLYVCPRAPCSWLKGVLSLVPPEHLGVAGP